MKLTIELVPQTSWYSNVRSEVSPAKWNQIKNIVFKKYNYCCAICNGKGSKHPVEAHEVWSYENNIQKLEDIIALCPKCHQVKHIGRAIEMGNYSKCLKHFSKVNNLKKEEAENEIKKAFEIWKIRSKQKWELNVEWLEKNCL